MEKLSGFIGEKTGSACWRTRDGRVQTTFGWYSVKMLPVFEEDIQNGHFKLLKSLERSNCIMADTGEAEIDDIVFQRCFCCR
jgi:molybdopterin-guanine dinucleotide biosynthesis protein A